MNAPRPGRAHEYLDEPTLDPEDLRINLREMAMLNRLPGGVATACGR